VAEEGAAFGDVEEAEGVLFSEDDGAGPFFVLEEEVDLGLADAAGRAFGVGLGVFDEGGVVIGAVVVGAVFPDVAGHVIEAEGIWGVRFDGGRASVAIERGVIVRKFSGEDVGEPFAIGLGFASPDVVEAFFTTHSASVGSRLPAHLA